ncbi:MAG TPA: hypothetical protein VF746_31920 [Longimicrobium sp.]|jgi:hypothetical protein
MRRLHLAFSTLASLLLGCAPDRPLAPVGPPARAQEVRVCAGVGDELREFAGWIDPRTGDTLVAGRPLHQVVPEARYAQGQPWFERREVITILNGRPAHRYGLPRSLSPADLREPGLRKVGAFQGVDIFEVMDQEERAKKHEPPDRMHDVTRIYYVPVSPGCMFQAYLFRAYVGPFRG